jgi:hypothetical protein
MAMSEDGTLEGEMLIVSSVCDGLGHCHTPCTT